VSRKANCTLKTIHILKYLEDVVTVNLLYESRYNPILSVVPSNTLFCTVLQRRTKLYPISHGSCKFKETQLALHLTSWISRQFLPSIFLCTPFFKYLGRSIPITPLPLPNHPQINPTHRRRIIIRSNILQPIQHPLRLSLKKLAFPYFKRQTG
jgi:hypothetical protein